MADSPPTFWDWVLSFFKAATPPPPPVPPRHGPVPPKEQPVVVVVAVEPPQPSKPGKKTLAGLVGASAAAALFVLIPREESGRVTNAVVENGQVTVTSVRGNEHLTPYRDVVGIWTVCDGDTRNVTPGQVQTREQCLQRLEDQLVAHTAPVLACVPSLRRPERENQLVAAVSLAYNIGPAGFCRSTAARRFNAGDWRGGCDAFMSWNKAGGRVIAGLTARRERERAICLRGL